MPVRLPKFGGGRRRCEEWNKSNPIGTPVILRKDDGTEVDTVTTSEAQMLSGHTAVIWLKGISGCYALDRVRRK